MDISGMIRRLGKTQYTITRASAGGTYSAGVFIPGPTSTFVIFGSAQPLTAEEILSLPEGDRTKERLKFYSATTLNVAESATLKQGDEFVVNGSNFRVDSVEHWPGYVKAVIVRVNTDAN